MARQSPWLRRSVWAVAGLLIGVVLGIAVVLVGSRTNYGHKKILNLTLRALGKSVQGTLTVGRISGNLLTGARLYDVQLRDLKKQPFVLADSADLTYDVRTLLSPRIVIRKAVLYNGRVYASKMPGDSLWNYQAIFADTTAPDTTDKVDRVTLLDSVRLVNVDAHLVIPWTPTKGLSPRARRAQIADVLSDSALTPVKRARGGYTRAMNFVGLNGRLAGIRFAPGTEAGSFFHIDSLGGRAQVFRDTFAIKRVTGRLALLSDHVEFDAPRVDLAHSQLSTAGVVRFPPNGADILYDILFVSKQVSFGDLRWIYPRFPRTATGALTLKVESRPEGLLFLAQHARVQAPGTRITGDFGVILGDTVRFTDVNLKADPLRVATIEAMLPTQLPVVGLHIGSAVIRGSGVRAPARAAASADTTARRRTNTTASATGARTGSTRAAPAKAVAGRQ